MTSRPAPLSLLALLLCCAGCGGPPEPPEPPPGPVVVEVAAPLDSTVEEITSTEPQLAVGLSELRLLLRDGEGARVLGPEGGATGIEGEIGAWSGAVEWDGELLVSASEGLHVLEAGLLVPSPLQALLDPRTSLQPLRVEPGGAAQLWLAGDEGLLFWREGTLHPVELAGLPTAGVELAWGGNVGGLEALWAASAEGLLALRVHGDEVTGILQKDDLSRFDGLAVDAWASVWLGEGNLLWRRDLQGQWTSFELPFDVQALACAPGSGDLWIGSDAGLFHQQDSVFRPVDGLESPQLLGVDPSGRALVSTAAGLRRVAAGRPTLLAGLAAGQELASPSEVTVHPSAPELLERLVVTLDGGVLSDSTDGELLWGADAPVPLDPLELADGPHELVATASYSDLEEPVEALLPFIVGPFVPPTWTQDIEPLFQENCERCHGAGGALAAGGGGPLDSATLWQADIELILELVEDGTMPAEQDEALGAEEIQAIRAWRAGGFPLE